MGCGVWEENGQPKTGGGESISIFNSLSWKDMETSHFNAFSSGGVYPTDSAPSWVESIRSGKAFFFFLWMNPGTLRALQCIFLNMLSTIIRLGNFKLL